MKGKEFRALMQEELGVTMAEFAVFVDRSYNTVSRWCRGVHEVPKELALLLTLMIALKKHFSAEILQYLGLEILLDLPGMTDEEAGEEAGEPAADAADPVDAVEAP